MVLVGDFDIDENEFVLVYWVWGMDLVELFD